MSSINSVARSIIALPLFRFDLQNRFVLILFHGERYNRQENNTAQ